KDCWRVAASVAFQQRPAIVANADAQTRSLIIVGRTPSRPAGADFSEVGQLGEQLINGAHDRPPSSHPLVASARLAAQPPGTKPSGACRYRRGHTGSHCLLSAATVDVGRFPGLWPLHGAAR